MVLARHQEHGLDLAGPAGNSCRHLELVVEIGHGAQAAHDHAGADLAGEGDQQRVERPHLDLGAGFRGDRRRSRSRTSSARSSSGNIGPLPALIATPTTSLSTSRRRGR